MNWVAFGGLSYSVSLFIEVISTGVTERSTVIFNLWFYHYILFSLLVSISIHRTQFGACRRSEEAAKRHLINDNWNFMCLNHWKKKHCVKTIQNWLASLNIFVVIFLIVLIRFAEKTNERKTKQSKSILGLEVEINLCKYVERVETKTRIKTCQMTASRVEFQSRQNAKNNEKSVWVIISVAFDRWERKNKHKFNERRKKNMPKSLKKL